METLRSLNRFALAFLPMLILLTYVVKHAAREQGDMVRTLSQKLDKARLTNQVLNAEKSHLSAPGRIDRLARKYLKLQDLHPSQLVQLPAQASEGRRGLVLPPHQLPGVTDDDVTASLPGAARSGEGGP